MRTGVLLCLVSCIGCSDSGWIRFNLEQPFIFKAYGLTPQKDFIDGPVPVLNQFVMSLGGVEAGIPNLAITITDGTNCPDGRNGYIFDADPTTIYVCPLARTALDRWAYTLAHEFGHVLGAGHVPCSTMGIMSDWGCQGPRLNYVKEDVAQICSNGRTSGGVCKVMP